MGEAELEPGGLFLKTMGMFNRLHPAIQQRPGSAMCPTQQQAVWKSWPLCTHLVVFLSQPAQGQQLRDVALDGLVIRTP